MQHIQKSLHQSSILSGNPVKQAQAEQEMPIPHQAANHEQSLEIIDQLFLRMGAIYGNIWRNLYKNQDFLKFSKQEWLEALSGFEEKRIYQTLSTCREKHAFPPTIPEFIECYRSLAKKTVYFRQSTCSVQTNPDVAEKHLQHIKTILNMK